MSAIAERPARDEPLLELKFNIDPRGQVDSRTPVRWCVGRPMLKAIEEKGIKDPYVVLVVRSRENDNEYGIERSYWRDTTVYVTRLTAELQFINFQRPGRNDVRAVVIDMNRDGLEWVHFMRGHVKSNNDSVFNDDGTLGNTRVYRKKNSYQLTFIDTKARQRVIVDAGVFAPEPAAWRQNLVAAYDLGKGADQCGFRKRFWFGALPLTLVGVPVWAYIPKIVMLALFMFFGRMPNKGFWKTAANPLNLWSWVNSLDGFTPSKWWHGKQAMVLWGLNPPVLLILPSVVWLIMHLPLHHYHVKGHSHHSAWYPMSWPTVTAYVDAALAILVIGAAVVILFAGILIAVAEKLVEKYPRLAKAITNTGVWLLDWWAGMQRNVRETKQEKERQRKLRLEAELAAMSCRNTGIAVSLDALPREKQTLRLRAAEFKTRVCKPFAV